jgi:hypothetical protein
MLTFLFATLTVLFAGCLTIIGFYTTKINGLIPMQKQETDQCISCIKASINNSNFKKIETVLEVKKHKISIGVDKVQYLRSKLCKISIATVINLVVFIMFLIVCSIAAKSLSMDIEKIFNEFLILGIFFILIAVSVVIYGIFHFTEVDDIDIFAQLIQKSNLKSITSKL